MATAAAYRQGQDYMRSKVETASQTQLVLMLYDGAIRFLSMGLQAMEEHLGVESRGAGVDSREARGPIPRLSTTDSRLKLIEQKNTYLVKGQRIISELITTLDHTQGGDVAANLHRIYTYMLPKVVEGNLQDKPENITEVIGLLRDLRTSWEEVDRQARGTAEG